MSKLSLLVTGGLLLAAISSKAQTADEIVKKHIDAIGGAPAWQKVTSVKMIGGMNMQGTEIKVNISTIKDKGVFTDINIGGMANYMIITPVNGWMYFPIQGQKKPEAITGDQLKQMQTQLDPVEHFIDYAAKGRKVDYLGKEDVEGTECYKLKMTEKDGVVTTYYFDPSSYYTIKAVQKVKADGKEMDAATTFSNYKKLPEGIVFPMTVESPQGPVNITAVEINTLKDESIFKPKN